MLHGEKLSVTRKDFLSQAKRMYDTAAAGAAQYDEQYRFMALDRDLNPLHVVLEYGAVEIDVEKYKGEFEILDGDAPEYLFDFPISGDDRPEDGGSWWNRFSFGGSIERASNLNQKQETPPGAQATKGEGGERESILGEMDKAFQAIELRRVAASKNQPNGGSWWNWIGGSTGSNRFLPGGSQETQPVTQQRVGAIPNIGSLSVIPAHIASLPRTDQDILNELLSPRHRRSGVM